LVRASCDDVLRPAAIIPWSQYQQRFKQPKLITEPHHSQVVEKWPTFRQLSETTSGTRWLAMGKSDAKPLKMVVKETNTRQKPVIRAQLRNRSLQHLTNSRSNLLGGKQLKESKEFSTPKDVHRSSLLNHLSTKPHATHSISIPNGVPFHAGTWEDGKPHYHLQKHPQQFAAATFGAANPLNSLTQNHLASTSVLNGGAGENIVNAIFAQSKAASLNPSVPIQVAQTAVQGAPASNPLESLLSKGASLDQISNLANKILNFGGGDGPKGGLIEAMTNALRGAQVPALNTAFQDDLGVGRTKPQQTIVEKLLAQAASAFNQSLKEKENKERQFRISKSREDSLKLLDKLPKDERELLKAAITSGELDADTLGPALKSLVKDDTAEESKKEKENRLTEWIRENRPTKKLKEIAVSADKLPYYGKYCGSFAEQVNTKKKFKPSENVTFWLGPLNQTENILADMFPSQNGFYVQPQPIDVSIFALDELPPMKARARKVVNVLSTGPKIAELGKETAKVNDALRVKKEVSLTENNKTTKNGRGGRKQVELVVKYAQPLEWFAGFQPLLLTLPDGKSTKSVHWVSLRDHKRRETVASVLLPNGPAFQIPKVVTLRGLSPNGLYNISSGPIRVIDIKTMEINNFSLRSGNNVVWFMIGKDILPNANGHIVPLYDKRFKLFDCESLRDYYNETVYLRLPGNLDIKDVFWFSVFSIAESVSYSHIYLPYNDMQLPPDLNGLPVTYPLL
uniref:DM13 domain-containing protein n=1 Tax=Angiostrongylus cantonensis TaxID=6313 RepID=A0A0K0D0N6_ANGCA